MKRSVALCVALFAAALVVAEEKKAEAPNIEGKWEYVEGMRAGEKVPADHLAGGVTITKDTITVPAGPDEKFLMAYKIKAGTPSEIDIEIKDGPVKEGKAIGIIEVKDGKMMLCYDPEGKKRPTKFESTKDNGTFYFVLKKAG